MNEGIVRRKFLQWMGGGACLALLPGFPSRQQSEASTADLTLRISPLQVEIAPGKIIKTTGYNGSVPGPFLRFREGQRVTVDVFNDTNEAEVLHWHGLFLPAQVDGAIEEGTPPIGAHSRQRYTFLARPPGTRWYHTHVHAGRNLNRATYSGQFGMVHIEPSSEPGRYDAEYSLCLHGWQPYLSAKGGEGSLEVLYQCFSINDRALGHGEPIRVREGQRALLRILNASATLEHRIALPGHQFTVVSLDGNPVPSPRPVDVLSLGPAERVDALVIMNRPGVWILGEVDDPIRNSGLGIVIEYENRRDAPQWIPPERDAPWDYTMFGNTQPVPEPDETIPLVFRRKFAGNNWVDHWTINNREFPKSDPILLRANARYRLRLDNESDDDHPVHLHRHTFELTRFGEKPTAGVRKDVVVVPRRKAVEVDFLANNPGPTLFHCHQQLHMDFGFMSLFGYAH